MYNIEPFVFVTTCEVLDLEKHITSAIYFTLFVVVFYVLQYMFMWMKVSLAYS